MLKCSICGTELLSGQKFCFECGGVVPQKKKCINCANELEISMKFCPKCGVKQDDTLNQVCGMAIGDRNVIAGDVIGSKEQTYITGNATIIKNEDQTKKINKCHICGSIVSIIDGYDCLECGEFTCEECYDLKSRMCKLCKRTIEDEREVKFKEKLKEVLNERIIDSNERNEIEELRIKYGISIEKALFLEKELKQSNMEDTLSQIERLNLEKGKEEFYEEGNVEKAFELINPIYEIHPFSEEVLNIFLPILIKKDISCAKEIISKTKTDFISIYLAEIEIAIIEKDFDKAERKIEQTKQIWNTNMLKYYEALLYLEFAKTTKLDLFVTKVEEIIEKFDKPKDKLELSYQVKVTKNLEELKGHDTSFYTKNFCKTKNLYTRLIGVGDISLKEFSLILPGSFNMGCENCSNPVHEVTITRAFYMGKYQITQEEWKSIMGENPSVFKCGEEDDDAYLAEGEIQEKRPVENIDWYEAISYCNKRSIQEGLTPCYRINRLSNLDNSNFDIEDFDSSCDEIKCDFDADGYRLPTEAEWEYAARAEDKIVYAETFSGTHNIAKLQNYAWFSENSEATHEVGKKLPNKWDLYDMSGNVNEWCWNWYTEEYDILKEGGIDPIGVSVGEQRVYRGGAYFFSADECSVSERGCHYPFATENFIGLRVVRSCK